MAADVALRPWPMSLLSAGVGVAMTLLTLGFGAASRQSTPPEVAPQALPEEPPAIAFPVVVPPPEREPVRTAPATSAAPASDPVPLFEAPPLPSTFGGGGPRDGRPPGSGGTAALPMAELASPLLGLQTIATPTVFDEAEVDERPAPVGEQRRTYPSEARALGIEGRVTLELVIDASGTVTQVSVLSAEPPGTFEAQAQRDARGWRYTPARHRGEPVTVRARTELIYALE
jgi:TonB family protein